MLRAETGPQPGSAYSGPLTTTEAGPSGHRHAQATIPSLRSGCYSSWATGAARKGRMISWWTIRVRPPA